MLGWQVCVWLFVRESEVQCGGTDAAVGMAE